MCDVLDKVENRGIAKGKIEGEMEGKPLAALTVRKHRLEGNNPISEADLEWIFARNYEGTE